MLIRAIVLDIGGVLIRTVDRKPRQELEKTHRLPPGGTEKLVFDSQAARASTIGLVEPERIWQNVAHKLSLSPTDLLEFQGKFWGGDRVDQALINFIQECRSSYITALLSNAWVNARQNLAEEYGIKEGETVDHIFISSELGVAKPDLRIYEILAESLDVEYDEILFIDDFIENIQAANTLGIHTIHYQPEVDLINEIKSRLEKI